MGVGLKQWGAIAIVFVVAAGLRTARTTDEYFYSDIADYERAAEVGVAGLHSESHSVTLMELVRKWKDPAFRKHPSDALYRTGDNLAMRHFHGPGSFYVLALSQDLGLTERPQRIVWSVIGSLTCALLVLALCLLGVGTLPAMAAGILAAVDMRNIWTDIDPSPHHTFYLMLVVLLFALGAQSWSTGRRWTLYAGAAVLALATLTFELAPALGIAILAGLGWEAWTRKSIKPMIRPLLLFLGVYVTALLVLYPGGFLRGTLLLCVFGNAGILLHQQYATASPSILPTLSTLFGPIWATLPLMLVFLAALPFAVKSMCQKGRHADSWLVACACYTGVALLFGLSAHFRYIPYCAEVFFPGLLFLMVVIHMAFSERFRWMPAALSALLLLAAAGDLALTLHTPRPRVPTDEIVRDMRTVAQPGDGIVLVNDINIFDALCLYLPDYRFEMTTPATGSLEMRHPEDAPQVRAAVVNPNALDAPARERAKAQFPPRFILRWNQSELWLGNRN